MLFWESGLAFFHAQAQSSLMFMFDLTVFYEEIHMQPLKVILLPDFFFFSTFLIFLNFAEKQEMKECVTLLYKPSNVDNF